MWTVQTRQRQGRLETVIRIKHFTVIVIEAEGDERAVDVLVHQGTGSESDPEQSPRGYLIGTNMLRLVR